MENGIQLLQNIDIFLAKPSQKYFLFLYSQSIFFTIFINLSLIYFYHLNIYFYKDLFRLYYLIFLDTFYEHPMLSKNVYCINYGRC